MMATTPIRELTTRIVQEFQPKRVILFGSYARGNPRPDSDVDLLLLLPFEGKGFRKSLEILNRVNPRFAVDLIARRPDDTARRYREADPLIREALDHGQVLHERSDEAMARQSGRRLSLLHQRFRRDARPYSWLELCQIARPGV